MSRTALGRALVSAGFREARALTPPGSLDPCASGAVGPTSLLQGRVPWQELSSCTWQWPPQPHQAAATRSLHAAAGAQRAAHTQEQAPDDTLPPAATLASTSELSAPTHTGDSQHASPPDPSTTDHLPVGAAASADALQQPDTSAASADSSQVDHSQPPGAQVDVTVQFEVEVEDVVDDIPDGSTAQVSAEAANMRAALEDAGGVQFVGRHPQPGQAAAGARDAHEHDSAGIRVRNARSIQELAQVVSGAESLDVAAVCWGLQRLAQLADAVSASRHMALTQHDVHTALERLCSVFLEQLPTMAPGDIASALHSLARLGVLPCDPDALRAAVCARLSGVVGSVPVQQLVRLAWSAAKLGLHDPQLFADISTVALKRISGEGYEPRELAMLAYSLALAQHHDWQLMHLILQAACPRLSEYDPPKLSQLAWATARQQHYNDAFLEMLAHEACVKLHAFEAHHVNQLVWSFATIRHHDQAFFNAASRHIQRISDSLSPAHVAVIAWGYAVRQHPDPNLYDALARRAVTVLPLAAPHHLSLLAWAFAKQGVLHRGLMAALAAAAGPVLPVMRPHNLSNLAWGFALLGEPAPELLKAIATAALPLLPEFNQQNLSDLAWSLSKGGVHDAVTFRAIGAAAATQLSDFSANSVSALAWAMANAGFYDRDLFEGLADAAVMRVSRMNAGMLTDLLWAFAVNEHAHAGLLQAAAAEALSKFELIRLSSPEDLATLWWCFSALRYEDPVLQSRFAAALQPGGADEHEQQEQATGSGAASGTVGQEQGHATGGAGGGLLEQAEQVPAAGNGAVGQEYQAQQA